jgi:pimeloyl-ACP methyl ester carboxylesterase
LRAVAPDLARHGQRKGADTLEAMLGVDYVGTMFGVIDQSATDLVAVMNHFSAPAFGLYAISLGGIVGFSLLVADPRIAAASMILASPDWLALAADVGVDKDHPAYDRIAAASPLSHATRIPPRALLMLNGEDDDRVPIVGARRLYEALTPLYKDGPDRLGLHTYPNLGHTFTGDMLTRSVGWLTDHLARK